MKQKNLNMVKGFTLVELLVVVAIIAILSVIGLTIFTSAQANARDARRKSDIDAIANALETARTPATVYYNNLLTSSFSGQKVPVDSSTAKYCIRTSTLTTIPSDAAWAATDTCPVLPTATQTTAASGESSWTEIPSSGLAASATAGSPFYTNTISWKVCAKLESGSIYCKPSSQ